jgi:hypothetical protein
VAPSFLSRPFPAVAVNVSIVLETRNAYTWVMPWRPVNPPGEGTPSCPVAFSGNSSFGAPAGCAGAVGIYPPKDLETICPYHPFSEHSDKPPCESKGCRKAGQCLNPYLYEPVRRRQLGGNRAKIAGCDAGCSSGQLECSRPRGAPVSDTLTLTAGHLWRPPDGGPPALGGRRGRRRQRRRQRGRRRAELVTLHAHLSAARG